MTEETGGILQDVLLLKSQAGNFYNKSAKAHKGLQNHCGRELLQRYGGLLKGPLLD